MAATKLTLAAALRIAEGAVATCASRGFAPVCVVVVDANGHQIVSQRMDGCIALAYGKFAIAKAMTCVSLGVSSRRFRDKYTAAKDPTKYTQMLAMVDCTGGGLAPFPGGVLLRAAEGGQILGAVGVSGASADEDELCALMGVREAGLEGVTTDPAEPAIQ